MKPTFGGYFEGILQLRNVSKEVHQWVHNRVKKDAKAAITKEKKVANGVDLYFNDQHYLQNLGHKLRDQFDGTLKTSRRLHTVHRMTSKLLYRVNVLFEPIGFKHGDKITYHGEEYEILRVEKKVHVKNLKTGQKSQLTLDALKRTMHAGQKADGLED